MPNSTESLCAQGVVGEQLQKFGDFKMLAAIGFVKFLMFGKSSGLSRAICKMPGNSMAVFRIDTQQPGVLHRKSMSIIRVPEKYLFYSGVFLLCMSVLMLQIVQTRILSVVSMYYLAFLSISMAMLGLTAGAVLVYLKSKHFEAQDVSSALARITAAYAIAIIGSFLVELASPVPIVPWATVVLVWLKLILVLAAPFVLAGISVSLALTRSPFPVGIVYGVDLIGAASGCLFVLVLLNWVDAPSAIFVIAGIAALSAVCFANAAPRVVSRDAILNWRLLRKPGWIAAGAFVLAAANASTLYGLQPISAKFNVIENRSQHDFEEWNSFSRITVDRSQTGTPFLWGASPTLPVGLLEDRRSLSIDAGAGTVMPRFNGNSESVSYLKYDVTNLAYFARHSGRAAVVGVGSGRDLLSAHLFGFRDITGVELNPIFVDFLTDPAKLRGYGGIADLPGVRLIVDDGRSWFARTQEKFDLLQMSMIDTFASTGAGAFSLSENGLYTVEAWRIFLSALTPNGMFTVSRWHSPAAEIELGRVVSLAMAALFSLGVDNPRDHIFLAGADSLATIVISRAAFSPTDLKLLTDAADRYKYHILASPDQLLAAGIFQDLLSTKDTDGLNARAATYLLDVSAPTNSRPFFFNMLRISHPGDVVDVIRHLLRIHSFQEGAGSLLGGNLMAAGTLLIIILLSAVSVLVAVVLPARPTAYKVDPRLVVWGTSYFFLIGLGFMFVEIALIQRMSVFMGHPTYGLSIVLFSIILSAGVGSMLSERVSPRSPMLLLLWLLGLGGYLLVLSHWLPDVMLSRLESSGTLVRALTTVVVIAPAGVLMGFGFPTGMRLVMAADPQPTPWLWGVNGAAGVLGSGLAVACSIAFSIDVTIQVGAVCYIALALVALPLMRWRRLPRQADLAASLVRGPVRND